jgi:hypothetical protein
VVTNHTGSQGTVASFFVRYSLDGRMLSIVSTTVITHAGSMKGIGLVQATKTTIDCQATLM